jgi:hypothetical protein
MDDGVTVWVVYPDGLRIYHDGKQVGLIPTDKFPNVKSRLLGILLRA